MSEEQRYESEPTNRLDDAATRATGSPARSSSALFVVGMIMAIAGLLMAGGAVWAYRGQGPIYWTITIVLLLAGIGLAASARQRRPRRTPYGLESD